jgi:signal transduction histidine kinase
LIEGLATQVGTALEHARLTARSRQLAVSDERNRIARDLHDSVTQTLFSISMIAQALPSLIERQPEKAGERAGRLGELSRGALAEMRMLILELRPQALQEMGLVEALRRHAEGWSSREGISAEVRADGLQRRLPQSHEEALFRVAQEALTNVAKHAQAQKATLVVDFEPQTVSLLVEDDGVGLPAAVDGGGLGMTTMRERVEGLHGNFSASRRAEGGTRVTACLPSPPPTTSITP